MNIKMKAKDVYLHGPELTKEVNKTLEVLEGIVGNTLGPGGRVILIDRPGKSPCISKDGVTVAESVSFKNALHYVVAEAIKEACSKTNIQAGDGTSTAIVLAKALVEYGQIHLSRNPAKSPQELVRELNSTMEYVVGKLKEVAVPVKSLDELHKVALISSNGEKSVADAVVEAIDMVGDDGTIITEEGTGRETKVELREGFPYNKGLSGLGATQEIFFNDTANQECVMEFPQFVLYDGDVMAVGELGTFLARVLEEMKKDNEIKPIVVVAHKFSPQVTKMIAQNVQMNTAHIVLLETYASAQPNSKHHLLHDLAAFVGGKVLDPITNTFNKNGLNDLGQCEKVRIGRYKSVFFGPPNQEAIDKRMEVLKGHKETAESEYDAEIIKERISQLSGGVATIYVGGSTDVEILERKHRIEDAICSVRSAVEMGIVPGGGATLICLAEHLMKEVEAQRLPASTAILMAAFTIPYERIMDNSGVKPNDKVAAYKEIVESSRGGLLANLVYDSLQHKLVDPLEAGIIDPVKVTISSAQNALSVAEMVMTLGGAIVIPRDKKEEEAMEAQAQAIANQMQGS